MNSSVTWRDGVPADLPRIHDLWDEQEKRFAGTNVRVDRPQLFWEEGNRQQAGIGDRLQVTGYRESIGDRPQAIGDREDQSQNQDEKQNQKQEQHRQQHRKNVVTGEELPTQAQPAGWRYRPPIMRLRVAEKAGQIVGFRYVEAVPEVCLVTGDEDVMKTLGRELTEECYLFKRLGFRSGWGLVPEKFAKALARFTRYSPVRLWNGLRLIGCDFSELGD